MRFALPAQFASANSLIYMSKANQLYRLTDDGLKGIKAEIQCKAQGGTAEVAIIEGDGGHLDGVLNVAKQGEAIRAFLAR